MHDQKQRQVGESRIMTVDWRRRGLGGCPRMCTMLLQGDKLDEVDLSHSWQGGDSVGGRILSYYDGIRRGVSC